MNAIVKNLRDARAIISAAPEKQINLQNFAAETSCGTLYCAAGWLANSERFKEHMRLKWETHAAEGLPDLKTAALTSPSGESYYGDWLDKLFGPGAFDSLFSYRLGGRWDRQILRSNPNMSDRDLALARIDLQILKMGYCP